jgi:hypothetical protein
MLLGAVLAIGLTGVYVFSLIDSGRNPHRYGGLFDTDRWWHALLRILAITVAAMVGAALAGANESTLATIAVVGFVPMYVCHRFLAQSAWRDRWRD